MIPDDIYACCSVVEIEGRNFCRRFYLAFMVRAANYDEASGRAARVAKRHADLKGGRVAQIVVNNGHGNDALLDPDQDWTVRPGG
jgi:hypothetical protein